MFTNSQIQVVLDWFVQFASVYLMPVMALFFVAAVTSRWLVHWTLLRSEWFAREFEKRALRFLEREGTAPDLSFYVVCKRLLEKTFYEIFVNREKLRRRKGDGLMLTSDRIFLIRQGAAWLVRDLLRQVRVLKHRENPNLFTITQVTLDGNPCFNKIFGLVPAHSVDRFLKIMPGLFVIGGIFGTFVGIMKGLPELSQMDLNNAELTKKTMDSFLMEVAHAMGASSLGIIFSVGLTLVNTFYSSDKILDQTLDRFENALNLLWHASENNDFPRNQEEFNEHRDPLEVLAESSIDQEVSRSKRNRDGGISENNKAS